MSDGKPTRLVRDGDVRSYDEPRDEKRAMREVVDMFDQTSHTREVMGPVSIAPS